MSIKIISKKILKPTFSRIGLINYTNDLSIQVRVQDGFISSKSFWKVPINDCYDKKLIVISISKWDTINDWNKWFNSKNRNIIHSNYKDIIQKETFSILNEKSDTDDMFLL